MEVTNEDFINWKNDPVTKAIFKEIQAIKDSLNESLNSDNVLLGDEKDRTLLVGQRLGINVLLDVQIDDEESEDVEDSPVWP